MEDFDDMKKRMDEIKNQYNELQEKFHIPTETQIFVFYAPLREIDAPNLVGIIFPEEDYIKVRERLFMKELNEVDNPKQYVGVYYDFENPFEILDFALANIDKSPQKILYEDNEFILTDEKLLSNTMNKVHISVISIEVADRIYELKNNTEEIKDYAEKLRKKIQK